MSDRFRIHVTPIEGLKVIERRPMGDSRGYFERIHCIGELDELMHGKSIVQINRSLTSRSGAVRGMHFQYPPHSEIKFVTCLRGAVFDVAVDLRQGSPTFLRWHGVVLTSENHMTMAIPEGFAHGFQAQANDCELLYLHTAQFVPGSEGAINARDPRLQIHWPVPISEISSRDAAHPMLTNAFDGVPA